MQLRYEVSPSEAGIVVDGLHARGFSARQETQALGEDKVVVRVDGVADATAVDEAVRALTSVATRLPAPQ